MSIVKPIRSEERDIRRDGGERCLFGHSRDEKIQDT